MGSIDLDKLGLEGTCRTANIAIRFSVNTASSTIPTPTAKIDGDRAIILGDAFPPASKQVRLRAVNVMRGLRQGWGFSCFIWSSMLQVLDSMLQNGEGNRRIANIKNPEVRGDTGTGWPNFE